MMAILVVFPLSGSRIFFLVTFNSKENEAVRSRISLTIYV